MAMPVHMLFFFVLACGTTQAIRTNEIEMAEMNETQRDDRFFKVKVWRDAQGDVDPPWGLKTDETTHQAIIPLTVVKSRHGPDGPQNGDIVVAVNDQPVNTREEFTALVRGVSGFVVTFKMVPLIPDETETSMEFAKDAMSTQWTPFAVPDGSGFTSVFYTVRTKRVRKDLQITIKKTTYNSKEYGAKNCMYSSEKVYNTLLSCTTRKLTNGKREEECVNDSVEYHRKSMLPNYWMKLKFTSQFRLAWKVGSDPWRSYYLDENEFHCF